MSLDQKRRLEEVFAAARDLHLLEPTAFLERVCGGDAELCRNADSPLAAHKQGSHLPERHLTSIRQASGNP